MYENRISLSEAGRERAMVMEKRRIARLAEAAEWREEQEMRREMASQVKAIKPQTNRHQVPTGSAWKPSWMK